MTKNQCNDWECTHNKNGYCETAEASDQCLDEARAYIQRDGKKTV